jgi:uncharacterized protein YegL
MLLLVTGIAYIITGVITVTTLLFIAIPICYILGARKNSNKIQPAYSSPEAVAAPQAAQPRMPLIFLLDTSASACLYRKQLNDSLNRFKSEVCQDRQAQDILDVAVLQFSDSPAMLQDFAPVGDMRTVRLISGGCSQYAAPIREALQMVEDYTRSKPSAYKPWIVLITGGSPSDDINAVAGEIQGLQRADKLRFMALGVASYNAAALKRLTDVVFRLDGADFAPFFDWISQCMWAIARSVPGEKPQLPQLQGNVYRDN